MHRNGVELLPQTGNNWRDKNGAAKNLNAKWTKSPLNGHLGLTMMGWHNFSDGFANSLKMKSRYHLAIIRVQSHFSHQNQSAGLHPATQVLPNPRCGPSFICPKPLTLLLPFRRRKRQINQFSLKVILCKAQSTDNAKVHLFFSKKKTGTKYFAFLQICCFFASLTFVKIMSRGNRYRW